MKQTHDLSQLEWKLSGWVPYLWLLYPGPDICNHPSAEIKAVPAKVPGSVQRALLDAGVIKDWNLGVNFRDCEWVENRHWIYETRIPDDWIAPGTSVRLRCLGLDYCGSVVLNEKSVGEFAGTCIPHCFDLTEHLKDSDNQLRIVFETPPRWLGQFGYTSRMKEWKARFNYFWDWTARLVQLGIWDDIYLECTNGPAIERFTCTTSTDAAARTGVINCKGEIASAGGAQVEISLTRGESAVAKITVPAEQFNKAGVQIGPVPVDLWWPNLEGEQPLYQVCVHVLDSDGKTADSQTRTVGFREVKWDQCEGAPEGADPWICNVNGRQIFLQGVNWVPILPNYADVTPQDYRKRLELYKDLGANMLRVWGGAVLEKQCFYETCDELGIMVWQEFPLSSSGTDCWPPDDQESIDSMAAIAESYVERRANHPSLVIWCGGNELICKEPYVPVDESHPMIARLAQVCRHNDPGRRFLVTSPSGPTVHANPANWGKGVHWDVHGPWRVDGPEEDWFAFWNAHDALFHSEIGSPSASDADLIRRTAGDCPPMPINVQNPLWTRNLDWWVENRAFAEQNGHEPETLEEYVEWSQARQTRTLEAALRSAKGRFPRCGGMLFWMGHDCFPCCADTSIIDFDGNPKPAALAIKRIWRGEAG